MLRLHLSEGQRLIDHGRSELEPECNPCQHGSFGIKDAQARYFLKSHVLFDSYLIETQHFQDQSERFTSPETEDIGVFEHAILHGLVYSEVCATPLPLSWVSDQTKLLRDHILAMVEGNSEITSACHHIVKLVSDVLRLPEHNPDDVLL